MIKIIKYNIKVILKYCIFKIGYSYNLIKFRKLNFSLVVRLKEKNQYLFAINSDSIGSLIMQITYLHKISKIYNLNFRNSFNVIGNGVCNKFLFQKINSDIKINYNNKLYNHLTKLGQYNYFIKSKYGIPYPNDYLNLLPHDDYKITFTEDEKEFGYKLLEKININENDNLVSVSWKSNYYWQLRDFSKTWDNFRCSDPKNLESGLKFLEDKNYKIVLVGDNEKCSLSSRYPSISNLKGKEREFLDIFIFSIVKFNILGEQGLKPIPNLFNKKTLHHNGIAPKWQSQDIFIPKVFIHKKTSKEITYKELIKMRLLVLKSDENISGLRYIEPFLFNNKDHFDQLGIELKENSPDEIKNGIIEIENFCKNNRLKLSREQEKNQSLYRFHFNKRNIKNNSSKFNNFNYGLNFGGYISPYFLEKYKFCFKI